MDIETEEKNKKIAIFRFGVIGDFVNGTRFTYGERESLIQEKVDRSYDIPFSKKNKISRATLQKWIANYKKSGYQLIGLYPKKRIDSGKSRKMSENFQNAIRELREKKPKLKVPVLLRELNKLGKIPTTEAFSCSSIYRFLQQEGLNAVNANAEDRRSFEAEYPNQIWQCDVLHGPQVKLGVKNAKTYLIAIIDDHSRLIVHAEFYLSETLESLKDCLKKALERRGLPQKFYIDNGACFRAINLDIIMASLGISITHSRPYTPQGRGKIERWFKFVRDNFLPDIESNNSLTELNEKLDSWVDNYNNKVHGTTKQTPHERFRKKLECVRHAPPNLIDHFRMIEMRFVKKDRTVRLNSVSYEVPVVLIDKRVELKYHTDDLDKIEVFFNQKSYGFVSKVNPHINANLGRKWKSTLQAKKEDPAKPIIETLITGGQLFEKFNEDILLQEQSSNLYNSKDEDV